MQELPDRANNSPLADHATGAATSGDAGHHGHRVGHIEARQQRIRPLAPEVLYELPENWQPPCGAEIDNSNLGGELLDIGALTTREDHVHANTTSDEIVSQIDERSLRASARETRQK
jgi:hypothetical protein